MADSIEWGFFDRKEETSDTFRNLPHKEQLNSVTFVTMRLVDSMPKMVVKQWHDEIEKWLSDSGLAGKSVDEVLKSPLVSPNQKNELRKFKNRQWHNHLDDCHGKCVLRNEECRAEVSKSILNFNGKRYDIESFVVMPNHVHVLIQMRNEFGLRKQFREIQRFSARSINRLLGRMGRLWQGEPFDHIVRSADQLAYLHNYIAENPKRAGLSKAEFTHWSYTGT